jgi:hypothetical protein
VKEIEIKVKRSLLFVMMLGGWMVTQGWAQGRAAMPQAEAMLFSAPVSHGASPRVPTAEAEKIGASAVWQPPKDFLGNAHTACDKNSGAPSDYGQCFIDQISKAGAPADAVSFTRMLFQQSDGQVGILTAFQPFGPVDAAQVFYPLRANDNYGLLLVNGDPKILDVDDLKKLNQAAMQQDPMFQAIKKQYPNADIWPGDRSGSAPWPRLQPLPNGGQQFIVTYPLIEGCHACRHLGAARFGWDFDASGKFLETTYIPTPPPPKLLKRPHGPQSQPLPPPPQQQPQPQQNPQ